jgi:hypothetical protein
MKCSHLIVAGNPVIVCGRDKIQACCECGAPATKLCDWKVDRGRTCDKPFCDAHAHSAAPNKDLCPRHAEAWKLHPENKQGKLAL